MEERARSPPDVGDGEILPPAIAGEGRDWVEVAGGGGGLEGGGAKVAVIEDHRRARR